MFPHYKIIPQVLTPVLKTGTGTWFQKRGQEDGCYGPNMGARFGGSPTGRFDEDQCRHCSGQEFGSRYAQILTYSVYDELGEHIWFVSPPNGVCTSYEAQ
jgi:hypothetical protein